MKHVVWSTVLLGVYVLSLPIASSQTDFDPYALPSPGVFTPTPPLELNAPYPAVPTNGPLLRCPLMNWPLLGCSRFNDPQFCDPQFCDPQLCDPLLRHQMMLRSAIDASTGLLPVGTIYPEYLADEKASRMAGHILGSTGGQTLLDGTLGSKFALFRRGPLSPSLGERAFEIAVEGSAQLRIDLSHQGDVQAVDFRIGVPLAYRYGAWNTRFGYYHLSSHLGDEFLLDNPTFHRINYSRDALFYGLAYSFTPNHRIYGETSVAVAHEISGVLDFKFGIERAPSGVTGRRGEPFWAFHGHLREEVDYGGHFTAQAGWAWRGPTTPGLLRVGLNYFNGKSLQLSMYNRFEQQFGLGVWYDY